MKGVESGVYSYQIECDQSPSLFIDVICPPSDELDRRPRSAASQE